MNTLTLISGIGLIAGGGCQIVVAELQRRKGAPRGGFAVQGLGSMAFGAAVLAGAVTHAGIFSVIAIWAAAALLWLGVVLMVRGFRSTAVHKPNP